VAYEAPPSGIGPSGAVSGIDARGKASPYPSGDTSALAFAWGHDLNLDLLAFRAPAGFNPRARASLVRPTS
jgi:hypothetical protein